MGVFTRDPQPEPNKPLVASGLAKPAAYSAHRSLTAAAVRVNVHDKSQLAQIKQRRAMASWQSDAWDYYDMIGEVKYAFRLFANVLSRIRLYPAYVTDADSTPDPLRDADLPDHVKQAATKAMRRPFGPNSQSELLRKAAINLLVAGECWLVRLPPKYGKREVEQWKILSIDELVLVQEVYHYKTESNQRPADMEPLNDTFIGRIWHEHPRYTDEADSSMKALVDTCDDLFLYNRAARASARSRLNAGVFFVPDSMSVSSDVVTDFPEDVPLDPEMAAVASAPEEDQFEEEMLDAFSAPITDESSASAVVPLIIRGPAEEGDKLRLIKFERPFDPQLAQRAERALERILQGIDLPKDIVTGLANVKYSNAVQVEESMYKSHVEPLVLMLCDAFRTVYLVPALRKAGVDEETIDDIVIWYDPSAIMTAPDKSNAANTGYDKMILSDEAWRRSNGFADTDAPSTDEVARRIAIQRGQINDAVMETLLRQIMPDIMNATRDASLAQSPTGPLSPAVTEALGGQPTSQPGTPPPDMPAGAPAEPSSDPSGPPAGLPPVVDPSNDDVRPA